MYTLFFISISISISKLIVSLTLGNAARPAPPPPVPPAPPRPPPPSSRSKGLHHRRKPEPIPPKFENNIM